MALFMSILLAFPLVLASFSCGSLVSRTLASSTCSTDHLSQIIMPLFNHRCRIEATSKHRSTRSCTDLRSALCALRFGSRPLPPCMALTILRCSSLLRHRSPLLTVRQRLGASATDRTCLSAAAPHLSFSLSLTSGAVARMSCASNVAAVSAAAPASSTGGQPCSSSPPRLVEIERKVKIKQNTEQVRDTHTAAPANCIASHNSGPISHSIQLVFDVSIVRVPSSLPRLAFACVSPVRSSTPIWMTRAAR
jgi:hypothetical protein